MLITTILEIKLEGKNAYYFTTILEIKLEGKNAYYFGHPPSLVMISTGVSFCGVRPQV
jgi:hypothetical protein